MINIHEYENSEEIPEPDQYPNTPWTHAATIRDKYNPVFEIAEDDQERANTHLWMLIGHSLRYDMCEVFEKGRVIERRKLKWREAFEHEREALAWRAFQKDIGTNRDCKPCDIDDDWGLYSIVNGERVERTTHRDHVWKLFKARLPERVAGKPEDILERVHTKREKGAKSRGESYWRKGHKPDAEQPQPPAQEALF